MTVKILHKANPQALVPELYGRMVEAGTRILNENVIPKEPIDTSPDRDGVVMREHTNVEVKVSAAMVSVVFFVGREIFYSWFTEFPERMSGGYHPRTPGTRMPWLRSGVREGMPTIINASAEAIGAWSV